jgi:APA family basic amino acid/polyamine antiporter
MTVFGLYTEIGTNKICYRSLTELSFVHVLAAKKFFCSLNRQYSMGELKRNIGLFGAASVGIANIIGAGIFVISGVAAGLAGPSVILSFLIAGLIALMTALSSAELASFITETGASYAFTKRAFGKFLGFLVGWFKYFDYIAGAAAVSVGFAAYFTELFGIAGALPLVVAAISLPIFFTILNLIGARESTYATSIMVLIKIFALVLLMMIGGYYLSRYFDISHFVPFFPTGVNGTFNGAAIIFFAFLGFNTVAMMSEETKNPEKTIPKALLLAFAVTFVLYIGIAFLEIGVLDWRALGISASPLEDVANAVSNNRIFLDFIAFSALVATGSVVLSSMIGGTRASFAMGRDRVLPRQFDKVSMRFGTPYFSVVFGGTLIIILSGFFYNNIDAIASIVNFGSLFTYLFVHLSLLKLRKSEPNAKRLFFVPLYPFVPVVGAASCILLMYFLSDNAKIASTIWFVVGLLLFSYIRKERT